MKAYNIWRIKLLNKYCFFSDMDYTQYRNVSSGTWAAMRKNTANISPGNENVQRRYISHNLRLKRK